MRRDHVNADLIGVSVRTVERRETGATPRREVISIKDAAGRARPSELVELAARLEAMQAQIDTLQKSVSFDLTSGHDGVNNRPREVAEDEMSTSKQQDPKRGRKPLDGGARRATVVLTEDEHRRIRRMAQRQGISFSQALRQLLAVEPDPSV